MSWTNLVFIMCLFGSFLLNQVTMDHLQLLIRHSSLAKGQSRRVPLLLLLLHRELTAWHKLRLHPPLVVLATTAASLYKCRLCLCCTWKNRHDLFRSKTTYLDPTVHKELSFILCIDAAELCMYSKYRPGKITVVELCKNLRTIQLGNHFRPKYI